LCCEEIGRLEKYGFCSILEKDKKQIKVQGMNIISKILEKEVVKVNGDNRVNK